ncbi:MAG: hypothetical protein ACF8XB_04315, partial [Planctomycetota bacterium JB042]
MKQMVKKSLFARLFHRPTEDAAPRSSSSTPSPNRARAPKRNGAAPAARAERPAPSRGTAVAEAEPEVRRPAVDPALRTREARPDPEPPKPADGPPVKASEMSEQEVITLKMKEGFKGITNVLSGIDQKIDRHQKTSEELTVAVRKIPEMMKDVPDASKAGVELLATISTVLEAQGRATNELLDKMGNLPGTMAELEKKVQTQVAEMTKAGVETRREVAQAFTQVTSRVDELSSRSSKQQDD